MEMLKLYIQIIKFQCYYYWEGLMHQKAALNISYKFFKDVFTYINILCILAIIFILCVKFNMYFTCKNHYVIYMY